MSRQQKQSWSQSLSTRFGKVIRHDIDYLFGVTGCRLNAGFNFIQLLLKRIQ
jgi:hypothetical protein